MKWIVLVALVACSTESRSDVSPVKPGGIRGRLTSHVSGGSVEGSRRRQEREEREGPELTPMASCKVKLGAITLTTDTDGKFTRSLPPGRYVVEVHCSDYCKSGPNLPTPATIDIASTRWLDVHWTCEINAK
jgi:hypothetical protein